jgi:hypothetical protein
VLAVERPNQPSLLALGQLAPLVKCHELDLGIHSVNVGDADEAPAGPGHEMRARGRARRADCTARTTGRCLDRRRVTQSPAVAKLGEIDGLHAAGRTNV